MHSLNRPMVFVAMMLLACSAALAQGGGAGSAMVAGMPPIAAPAIVTDSVQIRFTSPPCFSTIIDSVVVSNGGADPLTVSPRVIGPAATDFVLVPPGNLPFTLPPGGRRTIAVRFAPLGPGLGSALLELASNDPAPDRDTIWLPMAARGPIGQALLSPAVAGFSDVCVGATRELPIQILYSGDVEGKVVSVERLGSGPSAFTFSFPPSVTLPITLAAPTGGALLRVTFAPPGVGVFTDSFRIVTGPCDSSLLLVVRGNGVDARGSVTPDTIDFGDVPVGTSASRPLTVRSIGASAGAVRGMTVVGSGYGAPASLIGREIPSGESAVGDVLFTPTATGEVAGTLCVVYGALCPDTICVTLRARGITGGLLPSRDSLLLYADSCADPMPPVREGFALRNLGSTTVRVTGLTARNGLVAVVPQRPLPVDLPPGDSLGVAVTWGGNPPPGTTLIDRITVETADTGVAPTVAVLMRRELSRLAYAADDGGPLPGVIDLGIIPPCDTAIRSITILLRNGGGFAERVRATFTAGSGFSADTTSYLLPALSEQRAVITYDPAAGAAELDTLVLRGERCGQIRMIPFRVQRLRELAVSTTRLDFGSVYVGDDSVLAFTLENLSTSPITIGELSFADPYTVASPALPFTLPPLGTITLAVRLQPLDTGVADGTLRIVATLPCPDTMTVGLTGRGYRERVALFIPSDLRGVPGGDVAIPLLLSDASALARSGATSFSATLRFRSSLLMPVRLRGSSGEETITSTRIDGGERVVTIDLRGSAPLGTSDTLCYLDARVLLGDTVATAIEIAEASFAGGKGSDVETADGRFTLEGLCVDGGDRLVAAAGSFGLKAALPNPSSGVAELRFETIENGPTSLTVYDDRGGEVAWLLRGVELPVGEHRVLWSRGDLPSGSYEVLLAAPSGRSRLRLIVVR